MTFTRVPRSLKRTAGPDGGFTLLESVFAMAVLTIVALGLLPLGMMASNTTENQGHLVARATEYAQDKMEQLLALSYNDSITDTRVFPAADSGGSGLALGGSADPAAPVEKYVDYLNIDGTLLASVGTTAPAGWYYKRVWAIDPAGTNMKKITITTTVKSAVGSVGRVPQATIMSLKTFPF
jgi:prepilin-type N-terminal cleavage/methylation domain-containing protein